MFSHSISSDFSENNSSVSSPKEAQQKMLRNSNIQKEENIVNTQFCQKHLNKKAKYYADNDKSKLFCSKCALSLALKGMKIEETSDMEEIMRKNRISSFTMTLKSLILECEQKSQNLLKEQNASARAFENLKVDYIRLFDQMIAKINILRQEQLQNINSQWELQNEELKRILMTLNSNESQLRQYQQDITRNEENIVKRMEMKPFEEIMGRYSKKVQEHSKIIKEMQFQCKVEPFSCNEKLLLQNIEMLCQSMLSKKGETPNKVHLFQQITDQCITKLQSQVQQMDAEGDEAYQSTCSNSMQHSQSIAKLNKPTSSASPMRPLPPYPKNQNFSRRDSALNTPDSQNKEKKEETNELQKVDFKDYKSNREIKKSSSPVKQQLYQTETQGLEQLQIQLNLGLQQFKEERETSPKHTSQHQPQINIQNSLNNSKSNSASKKDPIHTWAQGGILYQDQLNSQPVTQKNRFLETASYNTSSQGLIIQKSKLQANKRSLSKGLTGATEVSKSEGKRQIFNLPSEPPGESLKDRIFKELSGGTGSESVYNQVLKINQKKTTSRYIKEKENFMSSDWGTQKKNSYLINVTKQR